MAHRPALATTLTQPPAIRTGAGHQQWVKAAMKQASATLALDSVPGVTGTFQRGPNRSG